MSIFNLFKKKNVEKIVEAKKELTIEERIELFKTKNSSKISKFDEEDKNQIILNVGDIVKLNVPNSPEMVIKTVLLSSYTITDANWWMHNPYISDHELKLCLFRYPAKIVLEYFDAHSILQELITEPTKVTKVVKKLDEQEVITKYLNQKSYCPDCGGELIDQNVCLASFPPKYQYVCSKCLKTITLTK